MTKVTSEEALTDLALGRVTLDLGKGPYRFSEGETARLMVILNSRIHINALGPAFAKQEDLFFWQHMEGDWYSLVFEQVDFVWKTSAASNRNPKQTTEFLAEFFTPKGLFKCRTLVDVANRLAMAWGVKGVLHTGRNSLRRTTRKKAGGANVNQIRRLVKE